MLKNWRELAKKIKEVVLRIIPDAEVYVFGSVVRGEFTAASDLDVLVVSDSIPKDHRKRIELKILIEDALSLGPNLVELHPVTIEESKWFFENLRIKAIKV